ncbi:MAG: molybdate transport system regulatory protein [Clostridia bacterium]|nr:ModE family transcriptional regulator [Clostridiales bacterium]MDK2984437.1 molybdate transport system regulatory protein [Clostridia bacterium]
MRVKYKVWLVDEEVILGDGGYRLLSLIDKNGSIRQATAEMDISYRQAWGRIRKMEKRYKKPLVETHTGGQSGGGASLTPEAKELVKRYRLFRAEVDKAINDSFQKYFSDL